MKKIIAILSLLIIVSLGAMYLNDDKSKKEDKEVVVVEPEEEVIEEDRVETITLVSVGDIMYHYYQILPVPTQPSGYNYYDGLKLTKPYFKNADIAIGNYETTTTLSRPYNSYPQFNTPAESLDAIADAGIDILSTINNHTLDSGRQGLIDTYTAIKDRGIIPLGTRLEVEPNLKTIERKGIKIGFLGYTYGFNGLDFMLTPEEHEYMVSQIDEEKIEKEIKESIALGNDMTAVMIHWGTEYSPKPNTYQKELAGKMAGWGADIILGSHPHVVQEAEMIDETFVIYSMGNFVSDQRLETLNNIDTERGLMVELEIEKNFTTNKTKITKIDYHPLWVNKYYREDNYYYETIVAKDFLENKIETYTPDGSRERIQMAYEETMKRVKGED